MPTLTTSNTQELNELENVLSREKGRWNFVAGSILGMIRDKKLYLSAGFKTFEEYLQKKWKIEESYASRLISSVKTLKEIPEGCQHLVPNERVARQLKDVTPEKRAAVLKTAASNGKVTASSVRVSAVNLDAYVSTPAPAKQKTEIKDAVELDRTGIPIPELAAVLWARSQDAQDVMTIVTKLKSDLKSKVDDKLFHEVDISRCINLLTDVHDEIKRAKPYAVCPVCQGKLATKCAQCSGRGVISQFMWDNTVPIELKTMREKIASKYATT